MLNSFHSSEHDFLPVAALKKIFSSENLTYYKGFGLRSANSRPICFTKNLQLIVFNELPNSLDIDFTTQELQVGAIYVIPPDHKYFISLNSSCQYHCFEICLSLIDNRLLQFVNAIAYQKQKIVQPNNTVGLLEWLEHLERNTSAIQILNTLRQAISQSITHNGCLPEQFSLANNFLKYLLKSEMDITQSIQDYAELNGCCARTLQRACLINFKVTPTEMIKHHLFMKSLKRLSKHNSSIQDIATSLGYANYNAFCKFTKKHSNLTPREIKRQLIGSEIIP